MGGGIRFTTAHLWAIAFIPSFLIGGVTGVMVAVPGADYQYHDSYFVVAHFHYVLVGGVVFAVFSGAYYWWPKIFGWKLNEKLGKIHFWLFFLGFHLTFLIHHYLGLWGLPRRVFTYLPNQGLETGNFVSTIGAILMMLASVVFLVNIAVSYSRRERAKADAWGDGRTMEWAVSSPPPEYNFARLPLVRSLDAWWFEKQQGRDSMIPAEPLGPIHMPSPTILPFLMSLGVFAAGIGFIVHQYLLVAGGFLLTLGCMFIRSLKDDPGYHIHLEDAAGKNA